MLENELKKIWKYASQTEKVKFEKSRLLIELKNRMKSINSKVKKRDGREIVAAAVGIILFTILTYEVQSIISKVGGFLGILSMLLIIYKLRFNQNKFSSDLSQSFREELENERVFVEKQAKLLNNVLYWYVIPPLIAQIVFILGLDNNMTQDTQGWLIQHLPYSEESKLKFIIAIIAFNGFVVWLNKRAVKTKLKPMLKEIDRVLSQFENEDNSPNYTVKL